tara:strand:+ start:972 stop:1406 length:435 start_codon:yes stop_codon:yes gene_type:complete
VSFRFKIKIKDVGGGERWADADKVFAHLMERYTKTIPKGNKPKPYKEKVEHFFVTLDIEWTSALRKAYPNVDIDAELNKSKMWLLSNTPKRNLKKFVNNWMSKAMTTKQNKKTEAAKYEKYVPPVINDDDVASPEEIKEILRRK